MIVEFVPKGKTKGEKERELLKKMKKQLDEMKFNVTPDKVTIFLDIFDEFCEIKHISKVQILAKRAKRSQSATTITEK